MSLDPDMLKLIGDLYSAATDPSLWEPAVRRLADVFSSSAAFLFLIDGQSVAGSKQLSYGMPDETLREYAEETYKICPRIKAHVKEPGRRVLYDYVHTAESEIKRHPFYDWLNKSAGMRYYIGSALSVDKTTQLVVTLQRTPAEGHVQRSDIEQFEALLPHFERVVQIRSRLGYLDARMQAADAALDRLSSGVVVVNASGAIASMNRAAENLLRDNDGLLLDRGHLKAKHWDDNKTLQATIRQAALTSMQRGLSAGGSLAVRRPSGRRSYSVLVSPIPRREILFVTDYPVALIFIVDPENSPVPPVELMRSQFGLTPTEAQLAIHLCEGMELKQAAETMQITLHTARTHLKRIFSKTQVSRQAEFIRLLLQILGGTG